MKKIIALGAAAAVLSLTAVAASAAIAPVMTPAAPVAGAAAPAEEEEAAKGPSEVTLTLKSCGINKVKVIKAVQAITGLGLMDAKKLVDAAPSPIKEHISPVEAEEHKKALVEAGAEVEIK